MLRKILPSVRHAKNVGIGIERGGRCAWPARKRKTFATKVEVIVPQGAIMAHEISGKYHAKPSLRRKHL
jgi:hypothetical protein